LSYQWQITDSTNTVIHSSTDTNTSYSFSAYGTYRFHLTATNSAGIHSTMERAVVLNAPPPSATMTASPADGTSPLTVTFTGQDLGAGPITTWEWDFDGDGSVDATGP